MSPCSIAIPKRAARSSNSAPTRPPASPGHAMGRRSSRCLRTIRRAATPRRPAAAMRFIVGAGAPAAVEACQALFEAMGEKIFSIGTEPAAANIVKLSGNFLIASAIEALGEAIALVGKAGVDRQAFVDLLTSSIFPVRTYVTYGGAIAGNKFKPAGFAAPLGFKDIRLAMAAAESLRTARPLARLLRDRFLRLLAQGGAELGWSSIGGLATQDASKS